MKFIESTHKYIDEENKEYTPVTYFLKSFQEKVDWNRVAAKKAKKDGVNKDDLLAQWADKRDKAADRGTAYHRMKEAELIASGDSSIVGYQTQRLGDDYVKLDDSVILEDNKTYLEKMIWSKRYGICGTADLAGVISGRIHISDYKTNEKLERESWVNPRTGSSKRLLFPLNHLDDCNFNIYQLQLNTYMYMLLQHNRNFKMGEMNILHVAFDALGNPLEPQVILVANLQKEVKAMLETFKNKQK